MPEKAIEKKSSIFQWSSDHWVWKVGTLASIIAIPLAIYFHSVRTRDAQLLYTFNPTRTEIVKFGDTSRLKILFDSSVVNSNLSAVQFIFWNTGTKEMGKVRDTLSIVATDRSKIYEARLVKTINQSSKIRLDTSKIFSGALKIYWDILDSQEGGVIQIIYGSSIEADFTVSGSYVGQKHVNEIGYNEAKSGRSPWIIFLIIVLWLCFIVLIFKLLGRFIKAKSDSITMLYVVVVLIISAALAFFSGIFIYDSFFTNTKMPFV